MGRYVGRRNAPARDMFTTMHGLSTQQPLAAWELERLLRQFRTLRGERGATVVEELLFVAALARCDQGRRALVANGQQDVDLAPDGTLIWGDLYCE